MPEDAGAALAALKWLRGQRRDTTAAIALLTTTVAAKRSGRPAAKPSPPPRITEATADVIAALWRYIDEIDQQHQALTTEVARRHRARQATRPAAPGSPWDMARRYYQANPGTWFLAADVLAWAASSGLTLNTPAKDPLQAVRIVLSHMVKRGELIRSDVGYQHPAAEVNGVGNPGPQLVPGTAGRLALG